MGAVVARALTGVNRLEESGAIGVVEEVVMGVEVIVWLRGLLLDVIIEDCVFELFALDLSRPLILRGVELYVFE